MVSNRMTGSMRVINLLLVLSLFSAFAAVAAEPPQAKGALSGSEIKSVVNDDVINLEGVQIRGNKELPSILYIVPWQEVETKSKLREHEIILHSLGERRIRPVMPDLLDQGVK